MKRLITLFVLCCFAQWSYAQCDNFVITAVDPNSPTNVYTLVNGTFPGPFCTVNLPIQLSGDVVGGVFSGPGVLDDIFNPISAGSGSYPLTYEVPGCEFPFFFTIVLEQPQIIAELSPDLPNQVCENGAAFEITGNSGTDGVVLIDGLGITTFDPAVLGLGPHEVAYYYTDPEFGCVSVDIKTITVNDIPDLTIHNLPAIVCINQPTIKLDLSIDNGRVTGPGVSINQTFDPYAAFLEAGLGPHPITHFYTDFFCNETLVTEVILIDVLDVSIASIGSSCYDQVDTLKYVGESLPDTTMFTWNIKEEDGFLVFQENDQAVVNWTSPGEKVIELSIGNHLCEDTYTDTLMKVGVEAIIEAQDQVVNSNTPVDLPVAATANVEGAVFSYAWSPSEGLKCIDCADQVAIIEETTVYSVTVTDGNGCEAVDEITLTLASGNVFVPNAFTPNGDGRNDVLRVLGQGIETANFLIFNRWGEKVFETNDVAVGWDATYQGEHVNSGIFFYVVDIVFTDGQEANYKGNVTVLR